MPVLTKTLNVTAVMASMSRYTRILGMLCILKALFCLKDEMNYCYSRNNSEELEIFLINVRREMLQTCAYFAFLQVILSTLCLKSRPVEYLKIFCLTKFKNFK